MTTPKDEGLPTAAQLRELQIELERVRQELRSESANGDVVELARMLVHDFNNFLNNIVLSLAVLEQSGEASSASTAPLRAQADRVSKMIKDFHNYRRKPGPSHQSISLNVTLRDMVRRLDRNNDDGSDGSTGPALPIVVDAAPELSSIAGAQQDISRLLKLLLRNSLLIAATNDASVRVKTSQAAGLIELAIEISPIALSSPVIAGQLDSLAAIFPVVSSLELAACGSIARRSHMKISVDSRSDAGLVIRLKAPAAQG
jgi:signal transduction histidine kinase